MTRTSGRQSSRRIGTSCRVEAGNYLRDRQAPTKKPSDRIPPWFAHILIFPIRCIKVLATAMAAQRKLALVLGYVFCSLLPAVGFSSQSSDSSEPIKGMAPGEYREKAELSREIPAQKPKAGGQSRR